MTLDNDKDLKSKNVGLKKAYTLGVTLIQAVVSKMLKIFCKIF